MEIKFNNLILIFNPLNLFSLFGNKNSDQKFTIPDTQLLVNNYTFDFTKKLYRDGMLL